MASSADGIDRSHLTPFCLAMEDMEEVSANGSNSVESPDDPLEPIQNAVVSTRRRLDVLEDEIKSIKRMIRALNRRMMAEKEKQEADRASLKTLLNSVHNAFCLYIIENSSP